MSINLTKIKGFLAVIVVCNVLQVHEIKAQDRFPNKFPLNDVKLLDGPFKQARDLNIQTLLKYDVDRLLAPYRKEAGLPQKAKSYPNWDGLDGHVGGHYLSAMAINYAATGNAECKKRMKACQQANTVKYPDWGVGYVGGIPNSAGLWSKIKAGEVGVIWKYWAPYYNIYKMFAGHEKIIFKVLTFFRTE